MKHDSIVVRVPASTSNLGSGFDTLGLALRLYNHVEVMRTRTKRFEISSAFSRDRQAKAEQLITEAAVLFFRRGRIRQFGFSVKLSGEVPIGRGLGASAILRVGIIAGLNKLANAGFTRQQILEMATELEGHPDNASPAIFGGLTVSGRIAESVRCINFPVSSKLKFVTLIPSFEISTEAARKLMPTIYSKADALHALNRAALIAAAFAKGDHQRLRGLFDDRIHQPYRARLLPALNRVIRAGERAGAIGGWLSGSGSSIICVTLERPQAVARAMQRELPDSVVRVLMSDPTGFGITYSKILFTGLTPAG